MKKKIGTIAAIAAAVLLIVALIVLDIGSWKSLDMEALTALKQTTVLYDGEGNELAYLYGSENRITAALSDLPPHVPQAFIAIEDARFYRHRGVDIIRLGGALAKNLRTMSAAEGASTITQQLIKLTHLTSEKTIARKAQEIWLALQLERRASKDEILEMYLNVVYFGRGAYGIEAASQSYFSKSASDLTLSEAALLAGVIKSPSNYAPHIQAENAIKRRGLVLDAMAENGFISEKEAEKAAEEPLQLHLSDRETADWYVDQALSEAEEILHKSAQEILSGGYRIYTAMQPALQQRARRLFEEQERFPPDAADGESAQAALICLDNETGAILALIGGREYETRRGLNRATQSIRQPGSAFKPISVYAAAVDKLGYLPTSMAEDTQRDFGNGYSPQNASGSTYGTVTLREALSRSMNVATVDLITRTGVQSAMDYARRFGIPLTARDANLSLALGSLTGGVSPAQMCAAYAALGNGGTAVEAHAVVRIEDSAGRTLYAYSGSGQRVVREESAFLLTSMLQTAVESGTARQLSGLGFPVAAKTGTVGLENGANRDAWVAAYTPKLAVTVWMGFDKADESHALPSGSGGGDYPARLAAAFLRGMAGGDFAVPDGLVGVLLDKKALEDEKRTLLAAENTPASQLIREYFPKDTIPEETSHLWDRPLTVRAVTLSHSENGNPVIGFTALEDGVTYVVERSSAGLRTVIGEASGQAGAWFFVEDEAPLSRAEYTVTARHDGFYEEGRLVLSDSSEPVRYMREGGIVEQLFGDIWEQAEPSPDPEAPAPLFE